MNDIKDLRNALLRTGDGLPPAERRVVLKMLETFVDFLGCGRDRGAEGPTGHTRGI